MIEIQSYNFGAENIRTIICDNEPWFIAQDICGALALTDSVQAVSRLDDEDKLIRTLYLSGQTRGTWTINESGLYSLILRSNKPEAKLFKKWVTSEVLPSIRKTGSYVNSKFKIPQTYPEALRLAAKLVEENETLKPKAFAHDAFMSAGNSQSVGDVAKLFGVGRNKFFQVLRDAKILMSDNVPYQEYMRYFETKEMPVRTGARIENKIITYVKPEGVDYFHKRFFNNQLTISGRDI